MSRRIAPLLLALAGCPNGGEDTGGGSATTAADPTDPTPADPTGNSGACGASPEALADCIEPARYEADLITISAPRPPGSDHWGEVQDLCASRLEAAGYDVELHVYDTGVNVIGRKDGTSAPDEVVLVTAHYDHIPDCVGADDNATGVAAALEIGRVLATAELPRTVMVACWDEEELELRGSRAFAAELDDRGIEIVVNANMDMIGYASSEPFSQLIPTGLEQQFPAAAEAIRANESRGDFILVVGNASAADAIVDLVAQADRNALPTIVLGVPANMELTDAYSEARRSDHAAIWEQGYPAFVLTDTAEPRNANYHCRGGPDVVDVLDHGFAVAVARSVAAMSAIAAGL